MTDQYYVREDEVATTETHLANIEAQQVAISAVDVWAEETFNGITAHAESLWNAAAERGDVDTQNRTVEIHTAAKHMKETLQYTKVAINSVLETAKALAKQKEEAEGDLADLLEAIENADGEDLRLSKLINQVETNVYEFIEYNAVHKSNDDEDTSDYDNIVSDVYKHIRELVPNVTYSNAEIFFASLKGDNALNDIQRGLLISLIRTFETAAPAAAAAS